MTPSVKESIIAELDRLPETRLVDVLAYVQGKSKLPKGSHPSAWHEFFGCLPDEDAREMERIIEEDFGRIDYEKW